MNYDELLVNCDALIKAGKISAVAEKIRALNFSQVPRKYRQLLGKICRRSGLIEMGLRLLHPIIRNEKPLELPASPLEICEYAVLLSRNGSLQEALVLLNSVDPRIAPDAHLYQGFCHVSQWNYAEASIQFEKFLASPADSYSKLIARVNLVAASIANGQLELADHLLNETMSMAKENHALRLMGNCFELRAQIAFFRGEFPKARSELARALEVLAQTGSYDQLLIQKWQTTMLAIETKDLDPLQKFAAEALQRKHWESLRDVDFYRLKIKYERTVFDHLNFGTPSTFYCRRVQMEFAQSPSEFYVFGIESDRILDLQTGQSPGADEISGKKVHQMIAALLRDFYAPCNIGTLFAELYPHEYFNIESSPVRVRQILRRTRRWLEGNAIPAVIEESNGSYKFVITGRFGVRIPFQREGTDCMVSAWQKILKAFQTEPQFTAEQACESLQISRTSFHRLSVWAVENNLLLKVGRNRATAYKITNEKISKVA